MAIVEPLPTVVQLVLRRLDQLGVKRQRLTVDSRTVSLGDVFAAIPGSKVDGRKFIATALERGAAAVLREVVGVAGDDADSRVIDVAGLSSILGDIADAFYGYPSTRLRVFGITGTNGKTSIASWLAQAFTSLGVPCGAVGTLGVSLGMQAWSTNNTTPDAAHVHTILRDLRNAGADAVAVEVSSHALELHRVAGVQFYTVIFTNLTQDHLDFHGSMEAYGAAKAKLFTACPARHRIINADDEFGALLLGKGLPNVLSYGLMQGEIRGAVLSTNVDGMKLSVSHAEQRVQFATPLIGRFNAYNLLAVAATLIAANVGLEKIATLLSTLEAAPGRMQRVSTARSTVEPSVYVDYAHTPDALAKALDTVRETNPRSLAVVFGCGGDRDRSKRPLMGAIAAERADCVYVTSDNPRTELPEMIIADIVAGIEPDHRRALQTIPLRRQAIRVAIGNTNPGDAVLIAGKGHETYQEIGSVRHAFSDVDEAIDALATLHRRQEPLGGGEPNVAR